MNRQKIQTTAVNTLLTFLAVLGGLGCLASGMSLPVRLPLLVGGCAVMALVFSLFWDTRLWLLPLCTAALLLGYWWQENTLRLSLESLIYQITDLYDRGYGWGILQWTDRNLLNRDVTPALLALGLPIAGILSLTTAKGRFGWLGCLFALLPLLCCALLKDTVPSGVYLGLLLFAVILVLMTEQVRRNNHRQANTLALTLTLPLTLALALLFTFFPRDTYHMQDGAQKLEDMVLKLFDRTATPDGPFLISGDQARTVELASVGKREKNNQTIMTVEASETGTLYLRGCAYDVYDGKTWRSTPGWNSWNQFYNSADNTPVNKLKIRTQQVHSVLYFAYNPYEADQKVVGGRMRNEEKLKEYTIYYRSPMSYDAKWDAKEQTISGYQLSEYLQLPDSTREKATQILSKRVGVPTTTTNAGQVWRNASYIANWVSQRAKYDLSTDRMPDTAEDFALWFLEESDTGYCTHYASAAVVLLRAAGIPAQYVTGYLVNAKANRAVPVTQSNAHAWVEVFINGVGWVMLEPTPAMSTQLPSYLDSTVYPTVDVPEPTVPSDTEVTEPSTENTVPVQTTVPDATEESLYHPTATVTPTTAGQAGIGGADPGTPGRQTFGRILGWILGSLCAVLAVLAQWRIRVTFAQRRKGTNNQRALRLWLQLSRACRLAKQAPAEEMHQLAQKARFSQHTLTSQELHRMQTALAAAQGQLQKKNLFCQLFYTLILAIY